MAGRQHWWHWCLATARAWPGGLADLAGHRYGAPAGDFWAAHRLGGGFAVWPGRRAGALGAVAGPAAVVALGLRSGHECRAGLRLAGRCRRAGATGLPDAGCGVALAPALSPSGRLSTLLLALVAVLLVEPLAALLPGFWLSFTAVATLIYCFRARLGGWRPWQAWTRAQWVMATGLLPVLLATGLPVSLSAPLANLVAVPWISLAVLPLALLGTLLLPLGGAGEVLLWLAGGLLEVLFRGLALVAQQRPAWLPSALPCGPGCWSAWARCWCCYPRRAAARVRWCNAAGLVGAGEPVPYGQVEVWQLDVGQGLAVLLRTRHHNVLYDAGPAKGDTDLGERVVLPTLRKLGVSGLDLMVVSHAHADHAGGAAAIQRGLPVGRVLGGEALDDVQLQPCASDERWMWDGVRFRCGAGPMGRAAMTVPACCWSRRRVSGCCWRVIWKPGPSGLGWRPLKCRVSIGCRRRTMAAAVPPPRPLFAPRRRAGTGIAGRNNSFGHPHAQVVERYRRHGVVMHDTAEQGRCGWCWGVMGT